MTYKQMHKWVNVIEEVTSSYNSTNHRGIKQSPASVRGDDEVYQWRLQYDMLPENTGHKTRYTKYKFKVGEEVMVSFLRRTFQK